MAFDNKLEFADLGNALASGAHARYFTSRAQLDQGEEQRRQAAQPYVQGAMSGDSNAMARVASGDPKTAAVITQALSRLDANKRAQVKASAEYAAQSANAVLQADPADRPAIYKQMLDIGRAQGHDVSTLPPEYSPAVDGLLRGYRTQAVPIIEQFRADEAMRRHTTPGARAVGAGGDGFDPLPGAPGAPRAPAAPPAAGPRADAGGFTPGPAVASATPGFAPPDVAQATQAPPPAAAAVAPQAPQQTPPAAPPQMASAPGAPPVGLPGMAMGETSATLATQAQPNAVPPDGFEAMGHRDAQGTLVPAQIDGRPVYRNPQTGEMRLGDAPAGPASIPSAGPAPRAPITPAQGALPPGIVQAPEGWVLRTKGGKAAVDGNGYFAITNPQTGQTLPYKPPTPQHAQIPMGYEPDPATPGHLRPIAGGPADKACDAIDPTLRGADLLKSLDPSEAAQVQAIVDGRAPLPALSSRMAPEAKRLRTLAFQMDPNFDGTVYASRAATQKDMADGKLAVQRTTANKLINHLGELHEVSDELNNSSTPLFNKVGNLIASNRGDPRIAKFEATKHLVAEEAVKFFSGTGGVTVSGMEDMGKLINSAQSPQQLQGVMTQITKLLNGQLSAVADQFNNGMKYTGDKRLKPEALLGEDARRNLERINTNPLGQKKPGGDAGNLKQLYGLE